MAASMRLAALAKSRRVFRVCGTIAREFQPTNLSQVRPIVTLHSQGKINTIVCVLNRCAVSVCGSNGPCGFHVLTGRLLTV